MSDYDEQAAERALTQIRGFCMELPEVTERNSHGTPTWFVREKKSFVSFQDDHHGDGRLAIWCAAAPGEQEQLVAGEPERYFRPPYVGTRGWLGVLLDPEPDWDEIREICIEAWRLVAPKRALAAFDADNDAA